MAGRYWPKSLVGGEWQGTFEAALPYLTDAFAKALDEIARDVPDQLREIMMKCIRHMPAGSLIAAATQRPALVHGISNLPSYSGS
jgi:hypothetical protein